MNDYYSDLVDRTHAMANFGDEKFGSKFGSLLRLCYWWRYIK